MRRTFSVQAAPTTTIASEIADTFASVYNSIPSQAEREARQAEIAAARAQGGYYDAQAQKVREEAQALADQREGRGSIAEIFDGIDYGGADFHPSGAHPSQQHRVDAPKTDPENTIDEYRNSEIARAAQEAFEVGVARGVGPEQMNRLIRNGLAAYGASPDIVQQMGLAADPSYMMGPDDALSRSDRELVAARNQRGEMDLQRLKERAAMERTRADNTTDLQKQRMIEEGDIAEIFASPLEVGSDERIYTHPDDPRSKGAAGPEYQAQERVLRGYETTPAQRQLAGAGELDVQRLKERGDTKRTRIQERGKMDRTRFETFNAPVTVGSDEQVLFAPGARQAEAPVQGPEYRTKERIASGYETTPEQRAMAGADESRTPRNYVTPNGGRGVTLDGVHDAATGEPIPQGSQVFTGQSQGEGPDAVFGDSELKAARKELLNRRVATESAVATISEIKDDLKQARDPAQVIGIVGRSARFINDMAEQAKALTRLTGTEIEAPQGTAAYQGTFQDLGIRNAEIQSAYLDLAYSIAQSRESGRLTENDIDRALRTVGANAQDPVAMARLLDTAQRRLVRDYRIFENVARQMYGDRLNVDPYRFNFAPQGPDGGAGGRLGAGPAQTPQRSPEAAQSGRRGGDVPVIDLEGNVIE